MKMASSEQPDPPTQPGPAPPGDAAAAAPREALISTAVKFLQNPRVRQSPLDTRKTFLRKKGLTEEEVELSIQRSGTTDLVLGPPGAPHPLQPALVPAHSVSGYRWRDYGALTIIMVGVAFGLHQFYTKYVAPLLTSRREDRQHLQRMESSIAAMSGTLTQTVGQLQQTLGAVQELLVQQQQKIQELSQELAAAEASSTTSRVLDTQTVSELKAEICSLKGLMLSRKQFPSTPSVPKIPSWQIPLKPPSAPASPSINSSSDISPVSIESSSSSPLRDGRSPQEALGGPDGAMGPPNGHAGAEEAELLQEQERMEVQGEEEEEEGERSLQAEGQGLSSERRGQQEEGRSLQAEGRRGGDGQINEQEEKLRRPEGASNESEVD